MTVNPKIKRIVDLLKIDLKYLNGGGNRYYTKTELSKYCEEREITLHQFIEYLNSNHKHYQFNLKTLDGIGKLWIGRKTKISTAFKKKYYNQLLNLCNKLSYKICNAIKQNQYYDEFVDVAMDKIILEYGIIVKNFYYDSKLLFNILSVKAKYAMKNLYRKMVKNIKNNSYDETRLNKTNALRDNYEIEDNLDNYTTKNMLLPQFKYYIEHDELAPQKALETIAHINKMSIKNIKNILKNEALATGFAKCKLSGTVILNET